MEDIPVMPIVRELFDTLPEWDVPELNLKSDGVLFFRDGCQVIRVKNCVATRYHAEFVRTMRYEDEPRPGPYTAADAEAFRKGVTDDMVKLIQNAPDGKIVEIGADGRIVESQTVVSPRNVTDELIELNNRLDPFRLPMPIATYMDRPEPVANAQDGSEVKSEELPTYNFLDPSVWGGLPRSRPVTGGYWRDDSVLYYQGLKDTEILKFRPTFDEIPF